MGMKLRAGQKARMRTKSRAKPEMAVRVELELTGSKRQMRRQKN